MSKRTSITERIKKSQNRETRCNFAHDWADKWEARHIDLIEQLKDAIDNGNHDLIIETLGDLQGLHKPKFYALHNVIDELIYPTRELKDE